MSSGSDKPAAIAQLYEVFSRYRPRQNMPRCEHCITQEEVNLICCRPLAELTEDDLSNFAWHALWTIGDAKDFRYFLPRVVEVMLWDEDRTRIDLASFFGKLCFASWHEWPADEQQAIRDFLSAWWQHLLSQPPGKHEAMSCLCGIAQLEGDLAGYLAYWRSAEGANPLLHLAETIGRGYGFLILDHMLRDPWWKDRPAQAAQVAAWMADPQTGDALEAGFFAYADAPLAEDLSDAAQIHSWVFCAHRPEKT